MLARGLIFSLKSGPDGRTKRRISHLCRNTIVPGQDKDTDRIVTIRVRTEFRIQNLRLSKTIIYFSGLRIIKYVTNGDLEKCRDQSLLMMHCNHGALMWT